MNMPGKGPLQGLRVLEMAGLGPVPFCGMVLSDLGADVIRIDRPEAHQPLPGTSRGAARFDVTGRGRRSLAMDLRRPDAVRDVLALVERADVLLEGFRPGVMERLGLGPDACMARRPQLVYARMTGWGQHGPLAHAAGHDINYIALVGALHAIGRSGEPPVPPLNYVGDYGGGAMLLAVGVLAALHERRASGLGQVVDAAMTDGAALLSAFFYGLKAAGDWSNSREDNFIDGGAHFYGTYACADGKHVAVGAIEPKFHARLLELCGIDDPAFVARQGDRGAWPLLRRKLAEVFLTRTRDEWTALLEGTDACVAPVLDWDEAPRHPHNATREAFVTLDGVVQPAPAPRFSRTPAAEPRAPGAAIGRDEALAAWSATAPAAAGGDASAAVSPLAPPAAP